MGLFKDFKEDFSQAVNEMMPGSDVPEKEEKAEDLVVNTLGEDVDVKSELSKLDGLLEQVKSEPEERTATGRGKNGNGAGNFSNSTGGKENYERYHFKYSTDYGCKAGYND